MIALFTSFDGRISRKSFWLGSVIILAIAFGLSLLVLPMVLSGGQVARLLAFLVSLVLIYPIAAVMTKRLHDRNKPALPWVAIFLAPSIIANLMQTLGIGYTAMEIAGQTVMIPGTAGYIISVISVGVALWVLIELGFLRGTPGQNAYGPDPLADGAFQAA